MPRKINDSQTAYYSNYDTFHNAYKKSKEAARRELINPINIFQTSNKYFINKYNLSSNHQIFKNQ